MPNSNKRDQVELPVPVLTRKLFKTVNHMIYYKSLCCTSSTEWKHTLLFYFGYIHNISSQHNRNQSCAEYACWGHLLCMH